MTKNNIERDAHFARLSEECEDWFYATEFDERNDEERYPIVNCNVMNWMVLDATAVNIPMLLWQAYGPRGYIRGKGIYSKLKIFTRKGDTTVGFILFNGGSIIRIMAENPSPNAPREYVKPTLEESILLNILKRANALKESEYGQLF